MIYKGGNYKRLEQGMLGGSAYLPVEHKKAGGKPAPPKSGLGGGKPLRGAGINQIYRWDNCKFLQLSQHFLLF